MKLVQKISLTFKKLARQREDRKLLREMRRQLPDMMAEMDRLVENMSKADLSIKAVMAKVAQYSPPPAVLQPEAPVVVSAAPPFNPDDCTVLQNPITVARQPIRVRRAA